MSRTAANCQRSYAPKQKPDHGGGHGANADEHHPVAFAQAKHGSGVGGQPQVQHLGHHHRGLVGVLRPKGPVIFGDQRRELNGRARDRAEAPRLDEQVGPQHGDGKQQKHHNRAAAAPGGDEGRRVGGRRRVVRGVGHAKLASGCQRSCPPSPPFPEEEGAGHMPRRSRSRATSMEYLAQGLASSRGRLMGLAEISHTP